MSNWLIKIETVYFSLRNGTDSFWIAALFWKGIFIGEERLRIPLAWSHVYIAPPCLEQCKNVGTAAGSRAKKTNKISYKIMKSRLPNHWQCQTLVVFFVLDWKKRKQHTSVCFLYEKSSQGFECNSVLLRERWVTLSETSFSAETSLLVPSPWHT